MPTLYLRCKTCNVEFASGISVDKKSFETMVLSGNQHTCPEGHSHEYDKKDYYFNPLAEIGKMIFEATDYTKRGKVRTKGGSPQ